MLKYAILCLTTAVPPLLGLLGCSGSPEAIIREDPGVEQVTECDTRSTKGDSLDRAIARFRSDLEASLVEEPKTEAQRIAAARLRHRLRNWQKKEEQWYRFIGSMKGGDRLYRVRGLHGERRFDYFVIWRSDREFDLFWVISENELKDEETNTPNKAAEPTALSVGKRNAWSAKS